jgi:hypothetical protein
MYGLKDCFHFILLDYQLKPIEIDFHAEVNREEHHTKEFENKSLIVRRGQVFNVSVTFDRPLNAKRDVIVLQFVTGN